MGVMRNLPDAHPLYKLLRPFFRYTMAINSRARDTLINGGGIIDRIMSVGGAGKVELIKRAYASYSVHLTNIVRSLNRRGVNNPEELPGYYYRDDGLKIWGALKEYVGNVIRHFYTDDAAVKADKELENFSADVHQNGFPGARPGQPDGHNFPAEFSTRESLIEHCTLIAFTGSAQHASVNFGQYLYYGFIPNAPLSVTLPPPTRKDEVTMETILKAMPSKEAGTLGIGVTHLLSQYSEDEVRN